MNSNTNIRFLITYFFVLAAVMGCKKTEVQKDERWQPPKSSYFVINEQHSKEGSVNVQVDDYGGVRALGGVFTGLTDEDILEVNNIQLTLSFYQGVSTNIRTINLLDSIPEGKFRKIPLISSLNKSTAEVSGHMYVDSREKHRTTVGSAIGNHRGVLSGFVYVNKENGKLRFSTDGAVDIEVVSASTPNKTTKRTVKFSGVSGETF